MPLVPPEMQKIYSVVMTALEIIDIAEEYKVGSTSHESGLAGRACVTLQSFVLDSRCHCSRCAQLASKVLDSDQRAIAR